MARRSVGEIDQVLADVGDRDVPKLNGIYIFLRSPGHFIVVDRHFGIRSAGIAADLDKVVELVVVYNISFFKNSCRTPWCSSLQ